MRARPVLSHQRLANVAFVVLVVFSALIVGLWRLHRVSFVSVQAPATAVVRAGDAVVTRPVAMRQLQVGDLVAYYNPLDTRHTITKPVAVINQTEHTFTPVGSSNSLASGLLVGRVDYRLAKLGYFLDFVRSRIGLVVGVYLPAMIVVSRELQLLAASYRRSVYRLWVTQSEHS